MTTQDYYFIAFINQNRNFMPNKSLVEKSMEDTKFALAAVCKEFGHDGLNKFEYTKCQRCGEQLSNS